MLPTPYGNFPRINFADETAVTQVFAGCGCYRIICMPAGKSYVGATADFVRRFIQHRQDLQLGRHPNSKLQWAWNKCGPKAFVFQVLEVYRGRWSKDCLTPMEQRWIDRHTRRYNIRPAGSDEWISRSQEGLKPLRTRLLASRTGKTQIGGTNKAVGGLKRVTGGDTRRPRRQQGRKK